MSDITPVNVPRAEITGWPTTADLAVFTGVDENDPVLQWALDKAIDYGNLVLSDRFTGEVPKSVFTGCLDYAGSVYVERVGQADITEGWQGSISTARYRRILLANRFTAIA